MEALPDELVAHVFAFLPCVVLLGRTSVVCVRWRRIASDAAAIGRRPCVSHWPTPDWLHGPAAAAGHHQCLVRADERGQVPGPDTLAEAVRSGHRQCIAHCALYAGQDITGAHTAAVESGDVDRFQFVIQCTRSPWHLLDDLPHVAASAGHLDMLAHLHQSGHDMWGVCGAAAAGGHLACLAYGRKHGCRWDTYDYANAAAVGHLGVLCYMEDNGLAPHPDAMALAVSKGHLGVIVHLVERGHPLHDRACDDAAMSGRVDVLEYVRSRGCPWTEATCASAAAAGHIDMLVHLVKQGCLWDAQTCAAAAAHGHLEVLTYARDSGCPWDARTTHLAAQHGHMACLEYACERGCPIDSGALAGAAKRGKEACFHYAHDLACPLATSHSTFQCYLQHMVSGDDVVLGMPYRRDAGHAFWRPD
ncbi:ankyrin repeat protein [Pandoravirus inopinatum]|uniref:Ankyrin repeat protein n=1 Tax=Pandoravirus inopinatum TaxID=1605721 RepID=A0A0B5JCE9_9VIRU|nr:ankyrin repeat protein [Pandoravirus inopinatum]AJF97292.1 ankyrin repeat protein [Pandoravirus inopinatum]